MSDQRAAAHALQPAGRLRPGQGAEVDGLVGVDGRGAADRGEIDVDMTETWRAHGQRGGQRDRLVGLAGERGQPRRDVNVGGDQDAGLVELAQESGARRATGGRRTDRGSRTGRSRGALVEHVAERLDQPRRAAPANTPHGWPSITGVPGPVIPRRNR